MKMILKGAAMALLLSGTAAGVATPAAARTTVGIALPGITVGFRDGYRDDHNRYHRWRNRNDYRNYRRDHSDSYSDWNHNRRH